MESDIHVGWIVFGVWFAGYWVTRLVFGLGSPFARTIDEDESVASVFWPLVWLAVGVFWIVGTVAGVWRAGVWRAVRRKFEGGSYDDFFHVAFRCACAVLRFVLKTVYYCTLPLRPFALGREIGGYLEVRELRKEQKRSEVSE